MIKRISNLTVVVRDQEEAMRWYTEKLGFEKHMDQRMGGDFRWLTVAAAGQKDLELTLASWKWYGNHQEDQVGKSTTIVLESSDCKADFLNLQSKGVQFTNPPKEEAFGTSAVFLDLYGNQYNLVERKPFSK